MEPGLLFDLDGVLIDSSQYHWRAWKRLAEEEKKLQMDYEEFLRGFGRRNEEILKGAAPKATAEERVQFALRKEALFREEISGEIELLPGVEWFLQEVAERELPRIIASSTPPENLRFFLAETSLGLYFDHYVSGDEVAEGKPAPDLFVEGARRLGRRADECIVFEDSPAGLEAGASAGCYVVAIATTHPSDRLEKYNMIVGSVGDLSIDRLIAKWEGAIGELLE